MFSTRECVKSLEQANERANRHGKVCAYIVMHTFVPVSLPMQNLFGLDDADLAGDIHMEEAMPSTPGKNIQPNSPKTAARLAYTQVKRLIGTMSYCQDTRLVLTV